MLTGDSRLDYVAYWFLKAGEYLQKSSAHIAFVSTNSITQGEQVEALWPALFDRYALEISFAHRTFAWGSDARGKAHVHVVIIGLSRRGSEPEVKRLFSYAAPNDEPHETAHTVLSPYLIDASGLADPHVVVERSRDSLCGMPSLRVGSKPVDGGRYIFDDEERDTFLGREPKATGAVRPFLGGREFINGVSRWILYPGGLGPNELRSMPAVQERIAAVRKFRAEEAGALGKSLAQVPAQFHVTVVPEAPFIAIAEVSSARREYVIAGYLEPPTIPSNQLLVAVGVERWHFSVIASAMHAAWLKEIGGRLKSDYRYSTGLVYNTFPWPPLTDADKAKLDALGQAILDARAAFPDATLADLYDPDTMPPALRKAHRDNDRAVDRLYRKAAFASDRERVEHLFMLYEQLKNPVIAATKDKPKRGRRRVAP